jgi:hypothetical protein
MWEVHYSREAAAYLEDNATLITSLFFAIESLANTSGMPQTGEHQEVQGLIHWRIQEHTVVLRRIAQSRVVRVLALKPD